MFRNETFAFKSEKYVFCIFNNINMGRSIKSLLVCVAVFCLDWASGAGPSDLQANYSFETYEKEFKKEYKIGAARG